MPRFDENNTDGYSSAELYELNRRFAALKSEQDPHLWQATELEYGSAMDVLAECVLRDFDACN